MQTPAADPRITVGSHVSAEDPVATLLAVRLACAHASEAATRLSQFVARARARCRGPRAFDPEAGDDLLAVAREVGVEALLSGLDAAELWHAAACAAGEAGALRIFDARYIARLDDALRPMKLDAATVEDVKQQVRERLLVAPEDGTPLVLQYAGGGRLAGLVKVMAMRTALNGIRHERRRTAVATRASDETVERIMAQDLGPELRFIGDQHRDLIRRSFQSTIAALPSHDRGVLRLHVLDRLTIDEIAAVQGVHRATAARRLAKIRAEISARVRDRLKDEHSFGELEVDSVMRAVDSRLELSLGRVLAITARADDDEL